MKFKIGDRVDTPNGPGVVLTIDGNCVGILHEYKIKALHNLGGLCEDGFGLWYGNTGIKLATPRFKGNK
jgi:hypothetical protein